MGRSEAPPAAVVAALIADVIGSRNTPDRRTLHDRLVAVLDDHNKTTELVSPLRLQVGDEFQGSYPTVGAALDAALRLRLLLLPEAELRFGIGWGAAEILDPEQGIQDGPGWWAAREAIEATAAAERVAATSLVRTSYRCAPDVVGPDVHAVNAALLTRDHLLGTLDQRSQRILEALMNGDTKTTIAEREGISASAVSQRAKAGVDLLLLAGDELAKIT
ncbi:SatD family protein [Yimella sp. cx-51]|uniref:SatD family protein n=1 Tax=Yimella sp. cx-51 TaxID=2770551 RepID=UPI00165D5389|nr:SatD family protein [Yimella sp. cx-51]MBC9957191.1 RNA polymerase subunit sigma-70 [Yimella sp. cx-51]MBD2758502.1 RNA polymerase subunit sigma-70 [Yimella sp. cx-573]QTH37159.1 RNA polymerase subunit sigma-70 [Yimella sp. cx-51]